MPALAATATSPAATALIAFSATVLIGGWLVGYALACWRRPFARCRHCHGTGHRPRHLLAGPCPACDATGLRLRYGRRLYNHLRMLHQEANR